MKPKLSQFATVAAVLITSLASVHARPDTLPEYDENSINTATVASFRTNHPSGYAGFVSDIDAAWNINEGGVIDEFSPSGLNLSFYSSPFTIGYGSNGYYNPTTLTTTGQSITFDDGQYEWDLATSGPTLIPAISLENFMIIAGNSIGRDIKMSTTTGANVIQLGFTLLENSTTDDITATAKFSDGSFYTEIINTSVDGNTFFGAVAPVGEFVEYFSVSNKTGNKIFIDDLAFSTVAVPEVSGISLAFLGLALAGRRRR